jgi:uncharacterized membrane protein
MKKTVLTLWLAGAAVYAVDTLIVTRPQAPIDNTRVSAQPEARRASNLPDQPLRSWGPFASRCGMMDVGASVCLV